MSVKYDFNPGPRSPDGSRKSTLTEDMFGSVLFNIFIPCLFSTVVKYENPSVKEYRTTDDDIGLPLSLPDDDGDIVMMHNAQLYSISQKLILPLSTYYDHNSSICVSMNVQKY